MTRSDRYDASIMVLQEGRWTIEAHGIMKVCQSHGKGMIFSRPANQSPNRAFSMLPKHIDRKHGGGFMCGVIVVIVMVDVNSEKGSMSPDFDGEEENSRVGFPVWEYFADVFVC